MTEDKMKHGNIIIEQRGDRPGRRITDKHCPFYPDNCRDILATKEETGKMQECLDGVKKEKLPSWVFKLFVTTFVPVSIIVLGWVGWSTYTSLKVTTRLETNQIHLMKHWDVEPVKKTE